MARRQLTRRVIVTPRQINRRAIKLVRQLFVDADEAWCLQEVRDLVSAFRGPDVAYTEIAKEYATTPIRRALLSKSCAAGLKDWESFGWRPNKRACVQHEDMGGSHFAWHIQKAAVVINNT